MNGRIAELECGPELLAALDSYKTGKRRNPYYGYDPAVTEQALKQITEPLLMHAGLGLVILNEYRWFVRELGRVLRSDTGPVLFQHVEPLVLKWEHLGLEPNTVALLLLEVLKRMSKMVRGGKDTAVRAQDTGTGRKRRKEVGDGTQEASADTG